jgi:hypothetical protein
MITNNTEAMNIKSFCYAISGPLGSVTIFLFELKILYMRNELSDLLELHQTIWSYIEKYLT